MQVKILRTTMADGRLVRTGSIEELSDRDAHTLIVLGKAVKVEAEQADEPVESEELTTETADELVADEAPKRKRGKKD